MIDGTKIRADLDRLAKESDILIVAMHWGEENNPEPTEEQKGLAQLLADLGVDVVIGTHPHLVQTPIFLKGANGNTTLVYYSLGNFISSQTEPCQMLGAMARFEIAYEATSGSVRFVSAEALPLVTHISSDYRSFAVYPLSDYDEGLAKDHALAPTGLSIETLWAHENEALGDRKLN